MDIRPFLVCRGLALQLEKKRERKKYHIDVPLLAQDLHLLLTQPRKTKHANLASNMIPRARRALGLQSLLQAATHFDDAAAHGLEVLLPLSIQGWVVEYNTGNARAVRGRIRNLRALQDG